MFTPLLGLQAALSAFTLYYLGAWWTGATKAAPGAEPEAREGGFPNPLQLGLGFVTNFFDTLGIGSFAPTTAAFKFLKMVPDRLIPGTLNVGHTLPTITQAFIYTLIIEVDPKTLALMIAAAVAGSWIGSGLVSSWPKRYVQLGMGGALLVAAALFTWRNLGGGGTTEGTLDLTGTKLALGLAGNFALGALMSLGIGMYAPCMILVGLLGMKASAAFPIMMGSCAFLMPIASARFVQKQAYSLKPALGLALGGIPAVFVAAFLVGSMDVTSMRWLVVFVVTLAAVMMLRSGITQQDDLPAILRPDGRLNRLKFAGALALIWVGTFALAFSIGAFFGWMDLGTAADLEKIGNALGFAAIILSAVPIVRRLHDLDRAGWHYWLLLVPIYGTILLFLLFFKAGTIGPNTHGDSVAGSNPS